MDEVVISFFAAIMTMIKYPKAKRIIEWQIRFFDKITQNSTSPYIRTMHDEIMLCKKRKRSRAFRYNASEIDYALNTYYISKSSITLCYAWNLFTTGRYKII